MSKFSTGLLVLTSPLHVLPMRIAPVLSSAAQVVDHTLYVHLHPGLNLGGASPPRPVVLPRAANLSGLISILYGNAADVCAHLDLRVLLANVSGSGGGTRGQRCPFPVPQPLSHSPDVVLTDFPMMHDPPGRSPLVAQCLQTYAGRCYVCSPRLTSVLLHPQLEELQEAADGDGVEHKDHLREPEAEEEPRETFSDVVVGGTFDRLHGAHRALLSTACLLSSRRLLVGLCDGEMLRGKVLKELIEPYATRARRLREFLRDVKPSLRTEVEPLRDPLGSSAVDPELRCMVVSEETRKGGEAVNRRRVQSGLPGLALHEIRLLKDFHRTCEREEQKISSSNLRSRLLGTLLTPPPERKPRLPHAVPYVIGLTGGSGSGKTSVAGLLEALGAVHIDADRLAHETYRPGAAAYRRVLEEFGPDVLNEDKTIDRRALGSKVFGDEGRLKALTDIAWPEVQLLVRDRIRRAGEEGERVCVVDAAVLLDAPGWTDMVHEVWVTVGVPEDKAVARITERDGLSRAEAVRRLRSRGSDAGRVERANVVLSTQWEPEVTQEQVLKAWKLLQDRVLHAQTEGQSTVVNPM